MPHQRVAVLGTSDRKRRERKRVQSMYLMLIPNFDITVIFLEFLKNFIRFK